MTRDRAASRPAPDLAGPPADLDGFRSRATALRQAAVLPRAEYQVLLEAALAELDGALAALDDAVGGPAATVGDGRALSGLHSDRRLLHAVFTGTPVPLYVVDHEGTVLRANTAACQLLGVGPGYATGKSLATLIESPVRAALRSQLAAAARTGSTTRLRCGMLADSGLVRCELDIRPLALRGDADRLLVAISPARTGKARTATPDAEPAKAAPAAVRRGEDVAASEADAAVVSAARRLDLLAAAGRQLLEGSTVSESVLLQRAARLLTGELATWAVVDVRRRGQLHRHYVSGPDDP